VRRVLALLEGREIPVTAQQLYAELRDAGDHTGRTTVYRALHALADAGLVHEFRGTDEIGYRACTPAPHDHLVCAGCGRVQERHLTGLDESLADLKREGFLVASCRIEVYGLCPRCTRRQSTVAPRAL
jgi:Fur family ferric uptake transcriptional regulator